ncbi:hypothetical protein [Gardnerella vaginalis]
MDCKLEDIMENVEE